MICQVIGKLSLETTNYVNEIENFCVENILAFMQEILPIKC